MLTFGEIKPLVMQKLQKVNPETLKPGDEVLISFPKEHHNHLQSHLEGKICKFISIDKKIKSVVYIDTPGGVTDMIHFDFLFVPTETQQEPVLIELEKAVKLLEAKTFTRQIAPFINYFAKPENQYQPKHPVPMTDSEANSLTGDVFGKKPDESFDVGDTVITKTDDPMIVNPSFIENNGKEGVITRIRPWKYASDKKQRYEVHGLFWSDTALTLVSKAEKQIAEPIPTAENKHFDRQEFVMHNVADLKAAILERDKILEDWRQLIENGNKPFDLSTAKELIKQGGKANELALQYYPELKEMQLPMKWEELEELNGYSVEGVGIVKIMGGEADEHLKPLFPTKEHAAAALALAQLLQLRECWIEIECKDWEPQWSGRAIDISYCVKRFAQEIIIDETSAEFGFLSFPYIQLAERFKDTFTDLIKTAFLL